MRLTESESYPDAVWCFVTRSSQFKLQFKIEEPLEGISIVLRMARQDRARGLSGASRMWAPGGHVIAQNAELGLSPLRSDHSPQIIEMTSEYDLRKFYREFGGDANALIGQI